MQEVVLVQFIRLSKKLPLSGGTIPSNACLHAPDGDGSAENCEGGEQNRGDGQSAPQRELAALQRFRAHMVQAVHGYHGLGNAGEKKVTNVVVVLFRAHMVQAVHGYHGLKNAGEKKVTNVVVIRNDSAPQRELSALQRFWVHMIQAVH